MSNGTSTATGGPAVLTDVTIENNVATSLGGGLFAAQSGRPRHRRHDHRRRSAAQQPGVRRRRHLPASQHHGHRRRPQHRQRQRRDAAWWRRGELEAPYGSRARRCRATPRTWAAGSIRRGRRRSPPARSAATAPASGPAINALLGTTDIVNTTLSGNVAAAAGGAGAIQLLGTVLPDGSRSSRVNLSASTIVDNVGAPGRHRQPGRLRSIVANILAANRRLTARSLSARSGAGHCGSTTAEPDRPGTPGCSLRLGERQLPRRPGIGVHDGGRSARRQRGPTATHALLPGSIAIDAGDLLAGRTELVPGDRSARRAAACGMAETETSAAISGRSSSSRHSRSPAPLLAGARAAKRAPPARRDDRHRDGRRASRPSRSRRWNGAPRATIVEGPTQLRIDAARRTISIPASIWRPGSSRSRIPMARRPARCRSRSSVPASQRSTRRLPRQVRRRPRRRCRPWRARAASRRR